ncbi:FCD domain-containing protein [Streptomyces sp. PKU-EA00015]|nr:FCD domain-containing protein [Streptomyces sp. PKU-EA00015]NWF29116.1 FCD domain-containing protein [Streptomyces sp. PKU-EA00015]
MTPDEAEEVYAVRAALERLAARLAAERATEEEVAELDSIVDTMAAELDRGARRTPPARPRPRLPRPDLPPGPHPPTVRRLGGGALAGPPVPADPRPARVRQLPRGGRRGASRAGAADQGNGTS